ncbi:MAG: endolytic transglycosylase MltG [Woeseia sp.]
MKRLLKFLGIITAVGIAVAVGAGWYGNRLLEQPLTLPSEGAAFGIEPGAGLARVSEQLSADGIISHPRLLRWYGQLSGQAAIKAGEYRLAPGLTSKSLLRKFVAGDVLLHALTIVEGWNVRELLQALANHPALSQTMTDADWPELLEAIGAGYDHPEGLFLPETYHFPRGTPDRDILRQAYALLEAALADEWESRATGLPLESPYEALILASIIEKETGRADERARIAGVFVRRLEQGMRLQTDPTVIYGLGDEFDGNLTRQHLQSYTDYNTYRRGGLPPTPIALAGRAAIHAALNPADGTELYFVATGLGDGSHRFSDTIEEHNAAVRVYLQRLRQAGNGQ